MKFTVNVCQRDVRQKVAVYGDKTARLMLECGGCPYFLAVEAGGKAAGFALTFYEVRDATLVLDVAYLLSVMPGCGVGNMLASALACSLSQLAARCGCTQIRLTACIVSKRGAVCCFKLLKRLRRYSVSGCVSLEVADYGYVDSVRSALASVYAQ